MRTTALLIAFATLIASTAGSQSREIIIMGGGSQDRFLGCLTCGEFTQDSVWNQYSRHGWENKFGTWNRFGEHANPYGPNSACNQFGTNAPVLVDRQGEFYGRLSVNEYAEGSVCGVNGAPQICRALKVM